MLAAILIGLDYLNRRKPPDVDGKSGLSTANNSNGVDETAATDDDDYDRSVRRGSADHALSKPRLFVRRYSIQPTIDDASRSRGGGAPATARHRQRYNSLNISDVTTASGSQDFVATPTHVRNGTQDLKATIANGHLPSNVDSGVGNRGKMELSKFETKAGQFSELENKKAKMEVMRRRRTNSCYSYEQDVSSDLTSFALNGHLEGDLPKLDKTPRIENNLEQPSNDPTSSEISRVLATTTAVDSQNTECTVVTADNSLLIGDDDVECDQTGEGRVEMVEAPVQYCYSMNTHSIPAHNGYLDEECSAAALKSEITVEEITEQQSSRSSDQASDAAITTVDSRNPEHAVEKVDDSLVTDEIETSSNAASVHGDFVVPDEYLSRPSGDDLKSIEDEIESMIQSCQTTNTPEHSDDPKVEIIVEDHNELQNSELIGNVALVDSRNVECTAAEDSCVVSNDVDTRGLPADEDRAEMVESSIQSCQTINTQELTENSGNVITEEMETSDSRAAYLEHTQLVSNLLNSPNSHNVAGEEEIASTGTTKNDVVVIIEETFTRVERVRSRKGNMCIEAQHEPLTNGISTSQQNCSTSVLEEQTCTAAVSNGLCPEIQKTESPISNGYQPDSTSMKLCSGTPTETSCSQTSNASEHIPNSTDGASVPITKLAKLETAGKCVFGVTHLHDRLFAVCREAHTVLVYRDQLPFERLQDVQVPAMTDPWDICACRLNSCLYITDLKGHCIWRVSVPENEADAVEVKRWLEDVDRPWTMSVTDDGRVILVSGIGSVQVFSPTAERLSTIPLPADIKTPLHVVELSPGRFLVSHGLLDGGLHQLCLLVASDDNTGSRIVRSFNGDLDMIREPWHVTPIGAETFCLTDSRNRRLLLLDADLQLQQVVDISSAQSGSGVGRSRPWRLSFVPQKGLLVVGFYASGIVVYSVQADS